MRMRHLLLLALLCLLIGVASPLFASERPKVVGYLPTWVDLDAYTDSVAYDKLTHIIVAFANPTNDGGDLSYDKRCDRLIEKARAAGVKVLISIGGGAASSDKTLKPRYFALMAADRRAAFADKLLEYVVAHKFDGLDVDIEGPSINTDYNGFIPIVAARFKSKGRLLTSALSVGYGGGNVRDETLQHFDFVNVMAYDATGSWAPDKPGQHSSISLAKESVAYWIEHGLPKEKVVLGLPFYGYGFGARKPNGNLPYSLIVNTYPGAEVTDEAGEQIFYNGIPTIRAKVRYALDEGIGGVMIWSLDNDVPGERSLLDAVNAELKSGTSK